MNILRYRIDIPSNEPRGFTIAIGDASDYVKSYINHSSMTPPPYTITLVISCHHKYLEVMGFLKYIMSKTEFLISNMETDHYNQF